MGVVAKFEFKDWACGREFCERKKYERFLNIPRQFPPSYYESAPLNRRGPRRRTQNLVVSVEREHQESFYILRTSLHSNDPLGLKQHERPSIISGQPEVDDPNEAEEFDVEAFLERKRQWALEDESDTDTDTDDDEESPDEYDQAWIDELAGAQVYEAAEEDFRSDPGFDFGGIWNNGFRDAEEQEHIRAPYRVTPRRNFTHPLFQTPSCLASTSPSRFSTIQKDGTGDSSNGWNPSALKSTSAPSSYAPSPHTLPPRLSLLLEKMFLSDQPTF
ncbi:uncharacterized protein MYCFIDRAFT_177568 [Pseudocercospora fijiensis CIRAD86]|uniref:Uncharacterized protein n=1 Tax=Pseudocercospora fijiensis (strain CIRAD86) TaxID=383855 RepID=M3A7P7_PSEFD|nr:uncharacterized protein MYCFIDRAFT_177568 [Pseudocercospora fijiensis CIRAD86]EME80636.1 hypothetical protein MYCFIDRAFT_177568 [Pseudocercospora fijiensis CIRAD86]